ncbi:Hypothetical predicted protein [Cloeon dipterum]|uniref:Bee-milk protein n=1 Tax=Cloeon dipterum TaxID=197152 RepID=A0A8S1DEX8_9INSE|nr:Hypothetical predicted protein [Cloeon dipterum]
MRMLTPIIVVTFSLGLIFANAVDFTSVFEWDKFEYEGSNIPAYHPLYMAVFEKRVFLSLHQNEGAPLTLVSLPLSNASAPPPKLAPFPSEQLHINYKNKCEAIQAARGIDVDSAGRLWVLDAGSSNCPSKLWIFNLLNNDATELVHTFPSSVISRISKKRMVHDLVLDETQDDCLAFIADSKADHLVVFSMKSNTSWPVKTQEGGKFGALARSAQSLYLMKKMQDQNNLYSVSLAELEAGSRSVNMTSSNFTETPYRMLIDACCNLYAAVENMNHIKKWKLADLSTEQILFGNYTMTSTVIPFTLALDKCGNLWMTEDQGGNKKPRFKLQMASVGSKPESRTADCNISGENSSSTSGAISIICNGRGGSITKLVHKMKILFYALICANALSLILFCTIILWALLLFARKKISISKREPEIEMQEISVVSHPDDVQNDSAASPVQSDSSEGDEYAVPAEEMDCEVLPEPENLYDDVGPAAQPIPAQALYVEMKSPRYSPKSFVNSQQ